MLHFILFSSIFLFFIWYCVILVCLIFYLFLMKFESPKKTIWKISSLAFFWSWNVLSLNVFFSSCVWIFFICFKRFFQCWIKRFIHTKYSHTLKDLSTCKFFGPTLFAFWTLSTYIVYLFAFFYSMDVWTKIFSFKVARKNSRLL